MCSNLSLYRRYCLCRFFFLIIGIHQETSYGLNVQHYCYDSPLFFHWFLTFSKMAGQMKQEKYLTPIFFFFSTYEGLLASVSQRGHPHVQLSSSVTDVALRAGCHHTRHRSEPPRLSSASQYCFFAGVKLIVWLLYCISSCLETIVREIFFTFLSKFIQMVFNVTGHDRKT